MKMAAKGTNDELLKLAKRRVLLRKTVRWHAAIYLVINALLCAIFYLTTPGGYFWPIWSMLGWGVGLIIHFAVVGSMLSSAKAKQDEIEKEYQMLKAEAKEIQGTDDEQ